MLNAVRNITLVNTWRTLVLVVVLMCCNCANAQLFINGVPAFSDSKSNIILFPVEKERFGQDFTAVVQADTASGWRNITVNGKQLTNNPITFEAVSGDKAYLVRAFKNNKPIVKRLMFTYLPIMQLKGDFGYDFIDASATLITPEGAVDRDMGAKIKWRGGFTNGPGRHKRNYSIKFVDENGEKQNRKLLGMRRDNHWKLDAAQVDMSRVRNRVATDLWLDMAHEPYYYNDAPDVITGVRGEMLELFVNNDYMGIYTLMECLDRKQLQVKKYDEVEDKFRGVFWYTNEWSTVTAFKKTSTYNNNLQLFDHFVIEYPEFEEVCPTNHKIIHDAVSFVVNGVVSNFNQKAHLYFDMPVIIDYAIFNQVLNAIDNEVNNIYWIAYDGDVDKKLTLAVWDLDWSAGMNRNSEDFRGDRAAYDYDYEFSSKLFNRLQNKECIYNRMMVERYWELRKTWLSTESITKRYADAIDRLIDCGAASRDSARWSGDSDINGLTLDLAAEKLYITDWLKNRLAYLDRTLMRRSCDINADGAINAADISALNSYILKGTSPFGDSNYDVNGDGSVNAADVTYLNKFILGY